MPLLGGRAKLPLEGALARTTAVADAAAATAWSSGWPELTSRRSDRRVTVEDLMHALDFSSAGSFVEQHLFCGAGLSKIRF